MLVSEPWTIDQLTITRKGDTVIVDMNGWEFPDPELGPASPGRFLINGQPFADVSYPADLEHVGAVFWQRPNARYSGFRCVATGRYYEIYRDGVLEHTNVNPGPPRRVPAQQSWYLCDAAREGAFPDEERRFRVIGNRDLDGFILTGLTDFKRLDAAAESLTGKGFSGYPRIRRARRRVRQRLSRPSLLAATLGPTIRHRRDPARLHLYARSGRDAAAGMTGLLTTCESGTSMPDLAVSRFVVGVD